jgi:Glycosyl hydrolase family 115/Gylcosyl hydrolase family 115 C-terminal domain
MKRFHRHILAFLLHTITLHAMAQPGYISQMESPGSFPLFHLNNVPDIHIDTADFPGVYRATLNLQQDLLHVTDVEPKIKNMLGSTPQKTMVIIGTLNKSSFLRDLIDRKKLDSAPIIGKRESFIIEVVEHPFPGVDHALVIAGSDKRGTIFGIYDLSRAIGVSPWYWWADVPIKKKAALYVTPGSHASGEPEIAYRGIFINDEEPALGRWAVERYGGFNHQFYEKVFELILRLKGNYLWPAMWWASFASDDSLNTKIADEYSIVIGTTHHEPMMRAHSEWKVIGGGPWNYATNKENLQQFWKKGILRMNDYESIVSLGMRGDGDMAMSEETNISLLENIVKDQRAIISDVTKKPIEQTPQLWALYKEVQDYYDRGMRVPDDVTLLLCDDNWGNIRKLPAASDTLREGGYRIYCHFDYVGGPRNYKWINTNPLPRIWEKMNLAYEYHARKIWLVNVGDIKPMEFPISFFLDFALKAWEKSVAENIIIKSTKHNFKTPGQHTVKLWGIDPGVVVQKIVIETETSKPTYLGPPESFIKRSKTN